MKAPKRSTVPLCMAAAALSALLALGGCEEAPQKPSESNTYNVHLYYGTDMGEHKSLGQVRGISKCKTTVHAEAARMQLKGHSYRYVCCWVHAGEPCHQQHK
ncbi:MAG: hypothetical protein ACREH3_01435 [Geminicoccales bacterium]